MGKGNLCSQSGTTEDLQVLYLPHNSCSFDHVQWLDMFCWMYCELAWKTNVQYGEHEVILNVEKVYFLQFCLFCFRCLVLLGFDAESLCFHIPA